DQFRHRREPRRATVCELETDSGKSAQRDRGVALEHMDGASGDVDQSIAGKGRKTEREHLTDADGCIGPDVNSRATDVGRQAGLAMAIPLEVHWHKEGDASFPFDAVSHAYRYDSAAKWIRQWPAKTHRPAHPWDPSKRIKVSRCGY